MAFDTEDSLIEYVTDYTNAATLNVLAAVVFSNEFASPTSLPDAVSYKIRPKSEQMYGEEGRNRRRNAASDWFTENVFPQDTMTTPREVSDQRGGSPGASQNNRMHAVCDQLFLPLAGIFHGC